jgi:hypothetical protein
MASSRKPQSGYPGPPTLERRKIPDRAADVRDDARMFGRVSSAAARRRSLTSRPSAEAGFGTSLRPACFPENAAQKNPGIGSLRIRDEGDFDPRFRACSRERRRRPLRARPIGPPLGRPADAASGRAGAVGIATLASDRACRRGAAVTAAPGARARAFAAARRGAAGRWGAGPRAGAFGSDARTTPASKQQHGLAGGSARSAGRGAAE